VLTADTYTSVLPAAQRRCADATAALVLAAARHTGKRIKQKAAKNRPTRPGKTSTLRRSTRRRSEEPQGHTRAAARIGARSGDTQAAPNRHPSSTKAGQRERPEPHSCSSGL
jgi:hypothetical protein